MFTDFNELKEPKVKKPPAQPSTEVVADSGAMPVNLRDDSSESSINSVKNKGASDKLDSARQNQFKMKWERVQQKGLKAARHPNAGLNPLYPKDKGPLEREKNKANQSRKINTDQPISRLRDKKGS